MHHLLEHINQTVFMLNSNEHDIYPAHKCFKCQQLLASTHLLAVTSESLKA